MVRRGAFGLLLLCVPQILGGGDAQDRSPRQGGGRSVRDSAVKPADKHRSRPGDDVASPLVGDEKDVASPLVGDEKGEASPLVGDEKGEASPLVDDADYGGELTRFRVVTPAGVLVIYDAAIPPGGWHGPRLRGHVFPPGADQSRERKRADPSDNSGFVAYWNDFATEYLYVFDRLLFTPDDAAVAVGSLQRDFVLDTGLFASDDLGVSRLSSIPPNGTPTGRERAGPPTIDDGSWQPASRELVLDVMGFAADEEGVGGVAGTVWGCGPIMAARAVEPLPAPHRGASPDVVLLLAIDSAGCPPGGPPPCGDPCCLDKCACDPIPGNCCDPDCSNCDPNDCDSDGIPNGQDPDVDGDGIPNGSDPDVDGDGIPNGLDCDIDGDGLFDWEDPDRDGDGIANDTDSDSDGDGIVRWEDPKPNGCEGPCDNSSDPCCGVTDPCAPAPCGNPCSPQCNDCDDGNGCTVDYCLGGDCWNMCPGGLSEEGSVPTVATCGCGLGTTTKVKQITFENDVQLSTDAGAGGWEVGGKYPEPDWIYGDGNPNQPAAYIRGQKMKLKVKLLVSGDCSTITRPMTVTGPDGIRGQVDIAPICGKGPRTVSVVMDTNLPNKVWSYKPMALMWRVYVPEFDEYVAIATTQHDIYVINAAPLYSTPTLKRVSSVCNWASGATTPDGIAMMVYNYLSTHEPPSRISLDAEPINYWGLMVPGTPTECSGLANLMRLACGVVGVQASVGYIYATRDCANFSWGNDAQEPREYQGQDERLMYWAGGTNYWEAVCVVSTGLAQPNNNHYYGPKVAHDLNSVELLRTILRGNQLSDRYQCWAQFVPQNDRWECTQHPPVPVPLPDNCNP